jgi:hypothetical protein
MDAVSGATERPCPHRIRVVTHEYEDIYGRSTQNAKLFQSVISPKAAVNHNVGRRDRLFAANVGRVEQRLWASRITFVGRYTYLIPYQGTTLLLLCHLADYSIARSHDQPGSGGGNYYAFQAESGTLLHGWKAIDAIEQAT